MPPAAPQSSGSTPDRPSNITLIRWMVAQGLRHPKECLYLLFTQVILLTLTLLGLSLVGLAVDILVHAAEASKKPPQWPFGLEPTSLSPIHQIWLVTAGIIMFAILRGTLRNQSMMAQATLVQSVVMTLRNKVYNKMQRLSFRFFDANESGSIINRATRDVTAIATFTEFAVVQVFILLLTLGVNFAYMSHIHMRLTIVSLMSTSLLVVVSAYYSWKVRPAYDRNRLLYDQLVLTLSENVQGHHVIEGFGLHQDEIEKFRKRNAAVRDQQEWIFTRASLYTTSVHMITQINLIIALGYGGYLVIKGELQIGMGLWVFTNLLQQFSTQVTTMAGVADTLQQSLTASGRVHEVLHAPVEIKNRPNARHVAKLSGEVRFENVSFEYKPGEPVLEDIDLHVKPGQCVAIMGATGAGKSTLLGLIPRFYDQTRGRILFDGIDSRDLDLDDLRRNIGLVFQESFLFSNTIAANISFGYPDAKREDVIRAAKVAAAHDFIMEMPHGYDTVVGEQGNNLSGGQRQRLAIARAILLEPSILLLDDATAAIDPETEHEILQAMDNVMQGRTTFVVANRLSTLRRADIVMVLEKGRIVQMGTHEQLVKAQGQYRQVAKLQGVDKESRKLLGMGGNTI